MKTYVVALNSMGNLTQIPDSQKLFGALVYLYSEEFGADRATELVQAVLHKKIHLALSNVMPRGYLPAPQDYLIDMLSKGLQGNAGSDRQELSLKQKRNEIKNRAYIQVKELKKIMANPSEAETTFPYIKLIDRQQLRISIESHRLDIPGLDNRLYGIPYVIPVEMTSQDIKEGTTRGMGRGKSIHEFHFYLQTDDSDLGRSWVNTVQSAIFKKQILILGKRASQGLNTFRLTDCQEETLEEPVKEMGAGCFLNTGMMLPDQISFTESTLKLFTSQRRPFAMSEGQAKELSGNFISFIKEGSMIIVPHGVLKAVKSIKSPFDPERSIVFGNAFLYPLHQDKGVLKHAKNHL